MRNAATTFIAGESSWRETNLAYSAALIAGMGTAWSMAACTVHRPSPESCATPRISFSPATLSLFRSHLEPEGARYESLASYPLE